MQDESDITLEALSGDAHMTPSDAPEAAEPVAAPQDALTLSELNAALGKNFTTKDAAIKAYKDTFSFVGKREEDIKAKVLAELQSTDKTSALEQEMKSIRKDMFYKDNPELAPYRDLLDKIGGDPAVAANAPEFKSVFEKAKGYDESQKLRTVLESNPRIASSKDNLSKARDAMNSGNKAAAEELAAQAVLDVYSK